MPSFHPEVSFSFYFVALPSKTPASFLTLTHFMVVRYYQQVHMLHRRRGIRKDRKEEKGKIERDFLSFLYSDWAKVGHVLFFFKILLIYFTERAREGERKGEKH